MSLQTAKITPTGVITDIPPSEVGADRLTYVQNVVFQDGAAKSAAGYRALGGTMLYTPQFILPNDTEAAYYWLYAADGNIGVFDGATHYNISPTVQSPSILGDWSGCSLNSIPVLCNSADAPFWWDGGTASPAEPLPNFLANTTVDWIASYKSLLIGGNTTESGANYENKLIWSDAADPGSLPEWTPTPTNLAGDAVLADEPGDLIWGTALRDHFLIFKPQATYIADFVGGQFVLSFRKLFVNSGLLAKNCAVEHEGRLYMFLDGDIAMTDGHAIQSIANNQVRRTVFSEIDTDNYRASYVTMWVEEDEIWFCYPTGGSKIANKAAVWSLNSQVWGFRDLPDVAHATGGLNNDSSAFAISWADQTDTWATIERKWNQVAFRSIADSIVMATQGPDQLYIVGELESPPLEFPVVAQKASMDFGDHERYKNVFELWPEFQTPRNFEPITISIRVGVQDFENEPIRWQAAKTFVINQDTKVDVSASGRLISFEVSGTAFGGRDLRFVGMGIRYRMGGRY